jgi:uncharacterized protein (DUF2236 family)
VSLRPNVYPLGRRDVAHPRALSGPDSTAWRLRQQGGIVMNLAKARAALLQLAHPKIAAGLAEHSTFDRDPFARVQLTGQTMSAISFGSPDERREALRLLGHLHTAVRGTLPDGDAYRADDPELMWFVLATLIDSDLLVEARYLRVFNERDRDAYYDEWLAVAQVFRIPAAIIAANRSELRDYIALACAELQVGADARRMGDRILDPTFLRAPRVARWANKRLLLDLLPPDLRAGFGYEHTPLSARVIVGAARIALPRLPAPVRRLRIRPRN